jgi:hypothetical protein
MNLHTTGIGIAVLDSLVEIRIGGQSLKRKQQSDNNGDKDTFHDFLFRLM